MKSAFERLAPFIQEYIYKNNWQSLRKIQVAAIDKIFDTDDNLLLASATASGKTEAAFLPIITDIYEHPSSSVGVLYISPLKALINDQFLRLEELLEEIDIPVTKWHGDVAQNKKEKTLKNPRGIMQTTPESLEAMLMRNKGNVIKLFSDLRYIVIDEIHYFMNDERGYQLLCILQRIERLIQKSPRRIGLSATLGDYTLAKQWLSKGNTRNTQVINIIEDKKKISLGVKYFEIDNVKSNIKRKGKDDNEDINDVNYDESYNAKNNNESENQTILDYYNYLYLATLNKKCIIFSNSKSEVEENMSHLKTIAQKVGTKDVYFVHHANVSSSFREYTEEQMKLGEENIVTGATLTLELGIDIGKLDRTIQTGTPHSVSSFVQRLGRSGRRDNISQMLFLFRHEKDKVEKEIYDQIDFEYIFCIALIELYVKEKWIEKMSKNDLPYSLLYHQTMSYLYSMGAVKPKELAKYILTLDVFKNIDINDYKELLLYLIQEGQLEKDEEGNILIGKEGELLTNHYDFFSVFEANEEFKVRCDAQEIGTIQVAYPVGEQFALAGFTWKVIDIDLDKKYIYVVKVSQMSKNSWSGDISITVQTKIIKKMKEILESDDVYSYLDDMSKQKLLEFRKLAHESKITERKVLALSPSTYAIFTWIGTDAIRALSYYLKQNGIENEIIYYSFIPICIKTKGTEDICEIEKVLKNAKEENIDKYSFEVSKEAKKNAKYNDYVPLKLLNKQYIEDLIDVDDMQKNI